MGNVSNMILNSVLQQAASDRAQGRKDERSKKISELYDQLQRAGMEGFTPNVYGPPESEASIRDQKISAYSELQGLGENPPRDMLTTPQSIMRLNLSDEEKGAYMAGAVTPAQAWQAHAQRGAANKKAVADSVALEKFIASPEFGSLGITADQFRATSKAKDLVGIEGLNTLIDGSKYRQKIIEAEELARHIDGVDWEKMKPSDLAYIGTRWGVNVDELKKVFKEPADKDFTPQQFLSFSVLLTEEQANNPAYMRYTSPAESNSIRLKKENPKVYAWYEKNFTPTGQPKAEYIMERYSEIKKTLNKKGLDPYARELIESMVEQKPTTKGGLIASHQIRRWNTDGMAAWLKGQGSKNTITEVMNAYEEILKNNAESADSSRTPR